jgi:hypothetical protein
MSREKQATDLLGHPLDPGEKAVLDAYARVEEALALDLAPCARANLLEARAALWQVLNDLYLTDARPGPEA